jgi:RNA polymerase sigma factor (sigma-70 family)
MKNPVDVFVVQLARASRLAGRFLRARNVSRADKDDILATAMAWCWANRASYSLTATIDTWFMGAVRHAYRDYRRGESRNSTSYVAEMASQDDPSYTATLRDAVESLSKNMDEVDRAIVSLTLDGKSHGEVSVALEIERSAITKRLNKMRDQLPESAHTNTILRRVITPVSPDDAGKLTVIDKDIAALDFPPTHGKECPPCWRCKWFEGYLPGDKISMRMPITEAEVRDAVQHTEAEKIRIATGVRDGTI